MSGFQIRTLESGDFLAIMQLEQEIFGAQGEPRLRRRYEQLRLLKLAVAPTRKPAAPLAMEWLQ